MNDHMSILVTLINFSIRGPRKKLEPVKVNWLSTSTSCMKEINAKNKLKYSPKKKAICCQTFSLNSEYDEGCWLLSMTCSLWAHANELYVNCFHKKNEHPSTS